jgi:hypothetical protein
MQANRIGLPHLEHGRIPISARLCSGFSWIDDNMLPLYWAGALPISLSPITAYSDGDGASLAQYANAALVNIAHIGKVKRRRAKSLQLAYENKSIIAGTSYRLTLFAPCL